MRTHGWKRPGVSGLVLAGALALVGCGAAGAPAPGVAEEPGGGARSAPVAQAPEAPNPPSRAPVPLPPEDQEGTGPPGGAAARPAWLGTRPLPLGPDGYGAVQPTPPELVDRRLASPDQLAPPVDGSFAATITQVPADIAARSTWDPACPVDLGELRYLNVGFWGFDDRPHTGELLVHADAADDVVAVFRRLHDERFPIEEMRVTRADELDAPPTGDGNNTGSFVCRPSRGTNSWSEHAYGRAVDVNPFHNPYLKGEVVLPELASSYRDRADRRPGMIVGGDAATRAFASIGWGWGGDWRSNKDYMHFSVNGR